MFLTDIHLGGDLLQVEVMHFVFLTGCFSFVTACNYIFGCFCIELKRRKKDIIYFLVKFIITLRGLRQFVLETDLVDGPDRSQNGPSMQLFVQRFDLHIILTTCSGCRQYVL